MAGRRTNLALLVVLPLAGLTGFLSFLVGSGPVSLVVIGHGVVGFAVLVLVPWKSVVVRRGLRRRNIGLGLSVLLLISVLVALTTGIAHSTGVLVSLGPISSLQLHVGFALLAIIPMAAHVWLRGTRPRRTDLSRRSALRLGSVAAAAGLLYAATEGVSALAALPGSRRRATGSYERSSGNPEGMPITSWLLDETPELNAASWRLAVTSDDQVRSWTLSELSVFGDEATVILDCTGGWWSRQTWTGVRLARLLPPGATGSVSVTSATGYHRRLPLTDDLLLAVKVGGVPLTPGHGAPVRLVVPGRRGFHWVKWVVSVEHDDRPWWLQVPLPTQ